jgi:hypothetical protein
MNLPQALRAKVSRSSRANSRNASPRRSAASPTVSFLRRTQARAIVAAEERRFLSADFAEESLCNDAEFKGIWHRLNCRGKHSGLA